MMDNFNIILGRVHFDNHNDFDNGFDKVIKSLDSLFKDNKDSAFVESMELQCAVNVLFNT